MCKTQVIRNDDFSTGFFQASQLAKANQQNFVSSPASALVLLSLLLSSKGPQGNTKNQICKAITGQDRDCNDAIVQKIDQRLREITIAVKEAKDDKGKKVVKISNAAFVQKDIDISSTFMYSFTQEGLNKFLITDFKTDRAFYDINQWVEESTEGLIRKLYNSADELSKDTILVLLNTIFFRDQWSSTFFNHSTVLGKFKTPDKSITIHMMSKLEYMHYYKNKEAGYHLIGKVFQNPRFKFVVILPTKQYKLDAVEKAMQKKFDWTVVDNEYNSATVALTLPRFKLEHELDLKATLMSLGIRDLFTSGSANLSGISNSKNLFVGEARQKTVLEVNENGVKAAAVSAMQIMPMSAIREEVHFNVNEPFFCGIYDSTLKMPLFVARVVNPVPL